MECIRVKGSLAIKSIHSCIVYECKNKVKIVDSVKVLCKGTLLESLNQNVNTFLNRHDILGAFNSLDHSVMGKTL